MSICIAIEFFINVSFHKNWWQWMEMKTNCANKIYSELGAGVCGAGGAGGARAARGLPLRPPLIARTVLKAINCIPRTHTTAIYCKEKN